ncbi:hypothetical protein [Acidicapsa acidisoli]|uniref:hypothetical protein n=1 Tax=Acidicapsa acidisoli TaxID=1615681 RepID=UPI0021E0904D|nr:hypothetical protein [Acidicapsa acidisoli]
MKSETKLIQWFVGLSGKILNRQGMATHVTFSLYLSRDDSFKWKTGSNPSEGLCRVSEEKGELAELFNAGIPVFLSSDELEATILLTSPGSFQVVGSIVRKAIAVKL